MRDQALELAEDLAKEITKARQTSSSGVAVETVAGLKVSNEKLETIYRRAVVPEPTGANSRSRRRRILSLSLQTV